MGGREYNKDRFTFANVKSANEYVDSAIAKNIQHSLKCYQYEGHFRSLKSLYEAGELTNAINRIVEDINHRFTLDVLTRDFRYGTIVSRNVIYRGASQVVDGINYLNVEEYLKSL